MLPKATLTPLEEIQLLTELKKKYDLAVRAFKPQVRPDVKTTLIPSAVSLWSIMVKHGAKPGEIDDRVITDLAPSIAMKLGPHSTKEELDDAALVAFSLTTPVLYLMACSMVQWADCGLPKLEIGHRFAAALLTTDVTREVLAEVVPPWRAFMIDVPDGLLEIFHNQEKRPIPIKRILCTQLHHPKGPWGFIAHTDQPLNMARLGMKTHELMPPVTGVSDISDKGFKLTDHDARVSSLIGQLIINLCLVMDIKGMSKPAGASHEIWAHANNDPRKLRGEMCRYKVGVDVEVDLRKQVQQYMRGEPQAVPVGTLIRGHFRLQPYGPGNALTKIIWRKPIRPHTAKVSGT